MVVHLDANSALTTMEGPWWSQMITGVAIGQFVVLLSRIYIASGVTRRELHWEILEFESAVELLGRS